MRTESRGFFLAGVFASLAIGTVSGGARADDGALYLATLTPEAGVSSGGSGVSIVKIAADATYFVVHVDAGNLTSARTGAHIHGPADPGASGPILFDLDGATPMPDGGLRIPLRPTGGLSVADILGAFSSGRLYVNLHTARYPAGEIRGSYTRASGFSTFTPPPPPPPLPGGPPSQREAVRFLTQATYGPTWAEMDEVVSRGYDAWLSKQFATRILSHVAYLDAQAAMGEEVWERTTMESIWNQAIAGPDPLRQRVALALSEILVVSNDNPVLGDGAYLLAGYMDVLSRRAFGNFRDLLTDATLHPAMGLYLNMLGNEKADAGHGTKPNENYAREILQLFSIGLNRLHPDGSLMLGPDGRPMPTYDQATVENLASVFTGWSWGGVEPTEDSFHLCNPSNLSLTSPMQPFPMFHDTGAKTLWGAVLPAGRTAREDLNSALDVIFYHSNVAPFLARQLIQRLVTSNPSPGYVYRVAQTFDDDGHGVRGNMRAVIRAILLDWEARTSDVLSRQGWGKVREPIVRFGTLLRTFGASAPSGRYRIDDLDDPVDGVGQNPLRAPSVFNFFLPTYAPPGPVAAAGLVAPEMQVLSETTAIGAANTMKRVLDDGWGWEDDQITLDLNPWIAIAGNPAQMVDGLCLLLLAGDPSPELRQVLLDTVNAIPADKPKRRVKTTIYLIVTSAEFLVQK